MKAKLQKYLSGSREGFSLVELIIVIAIMAILIGVVALAVLPYLNRSRESKDIQTLNTICSALSTAVATSQVTTAGSFTIDASGNVSDTTNAVAAELKNSLGAGSTALKSKACASGTITCAYDPSANSIMVYAAGASDFDSVTTGYKDQSGTPVADENGKFPCIAN